jgi:hypothetical protein
MNLQSCTLWPVEPVVCGNTQLSAADTKSSQANHLATERHAAVRCSLAADINQTHPVAHLKESVMGCPGFKNEQLPRATIHRPDMCANSRTPHHMDNGTTGAMVPAQ